MTGRRQQTFRMTLSGLELRELLLAAQARKMEPNDLFERLIVILLHERLIDAVMDDAGDLVERAVAPITNVVEGTCFES